MRKGLIVAAWGAAILGSVEIIWWFALAAAAGGVLVALAIRRLRA